MNGLGINKASKNDKDADILTPDEVALLRTHACSFFSVDSVVENQRTRCIKKGGVFTWV